MNIFYKGSVLLLLFCFALNVVIVGQSYLYVSLKGDDAVKVYLVDSTTGGLIYVDSESVSGQPASIALHPTKKFLYVARRSDKMISSYAIDSLSGRLTFINEINAVDNPVYLSTDQKGNYLLSAYYNANKAAVYSINENGSLVASPIKEIFTGTNPHAIITDPSNQYLYISNMTGNQVEQFKFNEDTGVFSSLNPATFVPDEGECPRHFVFNTSGTILYVVNEVKNSVSVCVKDELGQLNEIQKISTLPAEFTDFSKCADIHITPDNRFLYASNRGHESIVAYEINNTDGKLALINYYPTAATPREFEIDPSGNYLYAAGETGNNLVSYRILPNGELDSLTQLPVGKSPSWVTAVQYGSNPETTVSEWLHDNASIVVYPNPFRNKFHIKGFVSPVSDIIINLYDSVGRNLVSEVFKGSDFITGEELTINYSKLQGRRSGVYYCEIIENEISDIVKLFSY